MTNSISPKYRFPSIDKGGCIHHIHIRHACIQISNRLLFAKKGVLVQIRFFSLGLCCRSCVICNTIKRKTSEAPGHISRLHWLCAWHLRTPVTLIITSTAPVRPCGKLFCTLQGQHGRHLCRCFTMIMQTWVNFGHNKIQHSFDTPGRPQRRKGPTN